MRLQMEMSLTLVLIAGEGTDNLDRQGAQFMVSYFLHKDKKTHAIEITIQS